MVVDGRDQTTQNLRLAVLQAQYRGGVIGRRRECHGTVVRFNLRPEFADFKVDLDGDTAIEINRRLDFQFDAGLKILNAGIENGIGRYSGSRYGSIRTTPYPPVPQMIAFTSGCSHIPIKFSARRSSSDLEKRRSISTSGSRRTL